MRGKFIVLYGPNNLGKSEQAKRLVRNLEDTLLNEIHLLKYPIYELPTGQRIDYQIRTNRTMSEEELQREFAANRYTFEPVLIEMLNAGDWVVAEDYKHTGMIWGMTNGLSRAKMESMNKGQLDPDLAILLDGERFTAGIERNHAYEGSGKWDEARRIHLEFATELGWKAVNANQAREKVAEDIWEIVSSSLICL